MSVCTEFLSSAAYTHCDDATSLTIASASPRAWAHVHLAAAAVLLVLLEC